MANGVYKIEIDVNNVESGSERLAQQTGEVIPEAQKPLADKKVKKVTGLTKIEDALGKENYDILKKGLGMGVTGGYIALDLHQQAKSFQGDSNKVTRINEGKRIAGIVGATAMLTLSGNYVGAALFVGYTALGIAKENRELINTAVIDTYNSTYYLERLVKDKTQRSR